MASTESHSQRLDPLLIVVSGPSGVGKDAVLSRMKEQGKRYHFTVTATTRPKRSNERDGIDYIFHSEESFRQMIEMDELLESAEVYGHLYGVPRVQIRDAMEQGMDVIMRIDVQGAATIRRMAGDALFIFLRPPSIDDLARRLQGRMSETRDAYDLRLKTAETEMERAAEFDYVVVNANGRLDETIREIEAIVERERRRSPRQRVVL